MIIQKTKLIFHYNDTTIIDNIHCIFKYKFLSNHEACKVCSEYIHTRDFNTMIIERRKGRNISKPMNKLYKRTTRNNKRNFYIYNPGT